MIYILYTLLAVGLVALDQWVKWWVTVNIPYTVPMGEPLPFIPRVFGLNHAHNTGGAWSMLNQHTWLLTVVSTLVALVILFVLVRRLIRHPFGVITLTMVLAGAVGNLIDRVAFHYVRDFLDFIIFGYDFPIFNVADMALCVGVGLLILITLIQPEGEKH